MKKDNNREQKFLDKYPVVKEATISLVSSLNEENLVKEEHIEKVEPIIEKDTIKNEFEEQGGKDNSVVRTRINQNMPSIKSNIEDDKDNNLLNYNNYNSEEDIRAVANYGFIIVLIASLIVLLLLAYMCFGFGLFDF